MLKQEGSNAFRSRLVCAVLSNRPLHLSGIRELFENPGVTGFEVCFAQLVDKLTNGTAITIDATGTSVTMRPGYVLGGEVEHACEGRPVGYFIEGVLPLCLFAKEPVTLRLTGATNGDGGDLCVDTLKAVTLPLLKQFGLERGAQLQVLERGLAPNGKGEVVLQCPIVRQLRPVQMLDPGFVKQVRGLAYSVRVSPQFANRMASAARGVFNGFLPDVYVATDHAKGAARHCSPGYGTSLVAESTTGCLHGTKRAAVRRRVSAPSRRSEGVFGGDGHGDKDGQGEEGDEEEDEEEEVGADAYLPAREGQRHPGVATLSDAEELGKSAAFQLLEEVHKGGCVDTSHQPLLLTLMALCPEDVSKVRLGKLSAQAVEVLRVVQASLGVTFKLKMEEPDPAAGTGATVLASCVGAGHQNISRKVT